MEYCIKKFLFVFFFFCLVIGLFAQENEEQKLINLLTTGRFFEAKEYYSKLQKDNVFDEFFQLYYKFETAKMLNKSDSAALFLEKLLENGDEYWGAYKFRFYDDLLEIYTDKLQNYPKALFTCERMRQYLIKNPFDVAHEDINNGFEHLEERERYILRKEKYPTIKFSRNNSNNTVKIKGEKTNYLFFDGTYNNKKIRTLFDTGFTSFFFMSEIVADSIGAKRMNIFDNETKYSIINGMELPIESRIVDSIKIGNASLYNIPIGVFKFNLLSNSQNSTYVENKEQREALKSFYQSIDIVMGYPAMFLMGKISINFRNMTFSFPEDTTIITNNNTEPNLFIYANNLYSGLEINSIPFTAHVDFGSNHYVQIQSEFYEEHKDKLPINIIKNKKPLNIGMLHKTWLNIPYETLSNPSLKFNGEIIPNIEDNPIEIYSLPNQSVSEAYNGHLGYPFFKSLGKRIVLDFKNMRIDVTE